MVVGHQKSSEFSDSALLTDSWAEEPVWRPQEGGGGRPREGGKGEATGGGGEGGGHGEEGGKGGGPREEGEAGGPGGEGEVEAAERPQEGERFQ